MLDEVLVIWFSGLLSQKISTCIEIMMMISLNVPVFLHTVVCRTAQRAAGGSFTEMKQVSDSGGKSTLRRGVACGRLTNMYSNN